MDQTTLTELFRKLGARNPEDWARSQIDEAMPQLARFLFLRQAWRAVVDEEDAAWIDRRIARAAAHPNEPYAGVGHALKQLRSRGTTNEEIIDLVRGMQAELLFQFCELLEDPGDVESEVEDVTWALFQTDEDDNALSSLEGLHESVLQCDPTGREMRPRPASH